MCYAIANESIQNVAKYIATSIMVDLSRFSSKLKSQKTQHANIDIIPVSLVFTIRKPSEKIQPSIKGE